jgi:hypothetical protein
LTGAIAVALGLLTLLVLLLLLLLVVVLEELDLLLLELREPEEEELRRAETMVKLRASTRNRHHTERLILAVPAARCGMPVYAC